MSDASLPYTQQRNCWPSAYHHHHHQSDRLTRSTKLAGWLAGWGPPPSLTPHSATGKLLICIYVCRVNRFIQCSSHRWVGGTLASSSRQRTMASQVRWTGREYIVRNPFRQSIICMWGREHVSQSSLCVFYIVKESWGFPTPGIRIACANAVSFYRMNKKIVALC